MNTIVFEDETEMRRQSFPIDRIRWDDLPKWIAPDAPLWINGHSSRDGVNDRVPIAETNRLSDSLRLIKVDELPVSVQPPKPGKTRPVLRGSFRYNGIDSRLKITDTNAERKSRDMGLSCGEYAVGQRYLTISLGEPFEGYCYKLIAVIIKARRNILLCPEPNIQYLPSATPTIRWNVF